MGENGRGRFVWFELNTTDPEAGRAFYGQVVGWGDRAFDENYHLFTWDGQEVAGSMALQGPAVEMGAPPHWLGYIGTPSIDATLNRAQALGGKVLHPPEAIPGMGRFAVLADPQGAVFGALEPEGLAPGHEGAGKVGEIMWHELATTDPEKALAFYAALFGWTAGEVYDMGPDGPYHTFKRPGAKNGTGGIFAKPDGVPVGWVYYARVADLDAAIAAAKTNGGAIDQGPTEVPGGAMIAVGRDPQGATFALIAGEDGA